MFTLVFILTYYKKLKCRGTYEILIGANISEIMLEGVKVGMKKIKKC
jgi:hypothetical protein